MNSASPFKPARPNTVSENELLTLLERVVELSEDLHAEYEVKMDQEPDPQFAQTYFDDLARISLMLKLNSESALWSFRGILHDPE